MLKIIGSLAVFISCTLIGYDKSNILTEQKNTLEELISMIDSIYIYLSSAGLSTDEILERLKEDKISVKLKFLTEITAETDENALLDAISKNGAIISRRDKNTLASYFHNLGKTDLEGQLMQNRLCLQSLNKSLRECEENCCKGVKLYRALGILAGCFVSIILI